MQCLSCCLQEGFIPLYLFIVYYRGGKLKHSQAWPLWKLKRKDIIDLKDRKEEENQRRKEGGWATEEDTIGHCEDHYIPDNDAMPILKEDEKFFWGREGQYQYWLKKKNFPAYPSDPEENGEEEGERKKIPSWRRMTTWPFWRLEKKTDILGLQKHLKLNLNWKGISLIYVCMYACRVSVM